ncbi:MAG: hypothetical protein JNL57_06505 [Bacteroidetes bacterium]|nr:hypothetical protein [Bacteroidota bacterium]
MGISVCRLVWLFIAVISVSAGCRSAKSHNSISYLGVVIMGGDTSSRRECEKHLRVLHDSGWKLCTFWGLNAAKNHSSADSSDDEPQTRYMTKSRLLALLSGLDTLQLPDSSGALAQNLRHVFGDYTLSIETRTDYFRYTVFGDTVVYSNRPGGAWFIVTGLSKLDLFSHAVRPPCDCEAYFDVKDTVMFKQGVRAYTLSPDDTMPYFGFAHIVGDSAGHLLLSVTPKGQEWDFTGKRHAALPAVKSNLHVNLRFYDETRKYMLYSQPDRKSAPLHVIDMKDTANSYLNMMDVEIKGCHKQWLKVEFLYRGKQYSGWLHQYDYCPNPFTTCS